jgi:hypothetical protein
LWLLEELILEIANPYGTQVWTTKVEEFLALGWPFAQQQVHLVAAVEVVLIGPIAKLDALEQVIGNIGIAGCGDYGGEPVEAGEQAVFDRTRLNLARPAEPLLRRRNRRYCWLPEGLLRMLHPNHV